MKKNREAREAYVESEITTSLAHQIRAMRIDRNLTQTELAKSLNTTQTAVSRLEDPSYGRLSLSTLIDLSKVFDSGLRVEFVSTLTMLCETYKPNIKKRHIPPFETEAADVFFYANKNDAGVRSTLTLGQTNIKPDKDFVVSKQVSMIEVSNPYFAKPFLSIDHTSPLKK